MITAQAKVHQFMEEKCRGTYPEKPTLIGVEIAERRHDFLAEENTEYLQAALAGDLTAIADALADQLYIVLGTAVEHGIMLESIFDAVHRSNMTKAPSDPHTVKVTKGADYVLPTTEIAAALLCQLTGLPSTPPGELKVTDETCYDCGCPQHEDICPECGHTHSRLENGPRKVTEQDSTADLDSWAHHMDTCEKCRPHLGHVPFGLCEQGKKIFFSLRSDE